MQPKLNSEGIELTSLAYLCSVSLRSGLAEPCQPNLSFAVVWLLWLLLKHFLEVAVWIRSDFSFNDIKNYEINFELNKESYNQFKFAMKQATVD